MGCKALLSVVLPPQPALRLLPLLLSVPAAIVSATPAAAVTVAAAAV